MNFDPNKGGDTYLYPLERLQLILIEPDIANIEHSLSVWAKHLSIGIQFAMNEGVAPEKFMASA